MNTILEILVFFFFLGILVLMLTGRYILKQFRKMQNAVEQAAEEQARQYREETRRQRQQYSHRQQSQQTQQSQGESSTSGGYETDYRPSDEPIIEHRHQKRENRKIFDDSDGEYVDFEEA